VTPPRPAITVVGLGPGAAEYLSEAARRAITEDLSLAYLRTRRHPAAARFPQAHSFDDLYESTATFDEVYAGIVEALVSAATSAAPRPVVYAVPGSPLVSERTVELLRVDGRAEVSVVPALSFLDLAWDRLGIDPMREGVRLVDAETFPVVAAGSGAGDGVPGPFLVGQCWTRELLSELKLCAPEPEAETGADNGAGRGHPLPRPVLLHHLGLEDEVVSELDWWDLDRTVAPDHLTSVYVPAWSSGAAAGVAAAGAEMARLAELMDTLRTRCPWDRAQTHTTLMPHLVEECYEVLDALAALGAAGDDDTVVSTHAYAHLEEELGDLLFQIVFHARLASERGAFELGDVARGIHDKLVNRHPHVFGDVAADSPDVVVANWEAIKKSEKGRRSVTEGIPTSLPALMLSNKLARKARSVGVEPESAGDAAAGAADALRGLAQQATDAALHPDDALSDEAKEASRTVGEILFVVADLAQRVGVDAEQALRARALALRDAVVEAERDGVPDREKNSR
jgi:tetrapyrrole methylase family protein/MazG family protein